VCYFACNWQAFVNTWKNLSILWKEGSSWPSEQVSTKNLYHEFSLVYIICVQGLFDVLCLWVSPDFTHMHTHTLMFAGAKNHRFFMGYLIMLLVMCVFMLYGCVLFWQTVCGISLGKGFWRGKVWFYFFTMKKRVFLFIF